MRHALQDKLIRRTNDDNIENTIALAIRRSSGDEPTLQRLAEQVRMLADEAKKSSRTEDGGLRRTVKRLYQELLAAADGGAPPRPFIEYKSCAVALAPMSRSNERKFASGAMRVEGYGSTFNGPPDGYNDVIKPGAFAASLAQYRKAGTLPRMFFSHDPSQIAGLWTSMSEDSKGLVVSGVLASTTLGNDLNTLIELGALDSLSIGFMVPPGGSSLDRDGLRIISKIDLVEVSLVSLPANPRAQLNSVSAASAPLLDTLSASLGHLRLLIDEESAESDGESDNVLKFPSRSVATDDESLADTAARVLASLQQR